MNKFSGQFAMGQAVLKSQLLSTHVSQFLIWNESSKGTYTSIHADDWSRTGRAQIITGLNNIPSKTSPRKTAPPDTQISIVMARSDRDGLEAFNSISKAAQKACKIHSQNPNVQVGLHLNVDNLDNDTIAPSLAKVTFTDGVAISENFASLLALEAQEKYYINYAGVKDGIRAYTLKAR